jgi:hypothetical protein
MGFGLIEFKYLLVVLDMMDLPRKQPKCRGRAEDPIRQ